MYMKQATVVLAYVQTQYLHVCSIDVHVSRVSIHATHDTGDIVVVVVTLVLLPAASSVYKRLASLISDKRFQQY